MRFRSKHDAAKNEHVIYHLYIMKLYAGWLKSNRVGMQYIL